MITPEQFTPSVSIAVFVPFIPIRGLPTSCDASAWTPRKLRIRDRVGRCHERFTCTPNRLRRSCDVTKFYLHHGDCRAGMQRLPAEHVDVVVTSPPYNLGIKYGRYSDKQDRSSYLEWCAKWAADV